MWEKSHYTVWLQVTSSPSVSKLLKWVFYTSNVLQRCFQQLKKNKTKQAAYMFHISVGLFTCHLGPFGKEWRPLSKTWKVIGWLFSHNRPIRFLHGQWSREPFGNSETLAFVTTKPRPLLSTLPPQRTLLCHLRSNQRKTFFYEILSLKSQKYSWLPRLEDRGSKLLFENQLLNK